jgi:hypothetical protein
VVYLAGLNITAAEDSGACEGAMRMYQALIAGGVHAPVWLATLGGQFVELQSAPPLIPSQAILWGLARSVTMENPDLRGGLVDLEPGASAADCAAALVDEILATDPEPEVAIRGGNRYVARMTACESNESAEPLQLRPDGAYLITGGLGGLGLLVARRFVARGARRLVLLSRHAPAPAAQAAIDEIRREGADVTVIQADVAREADLDETLRRIEPPLCGIVHAAGVLDDGFLPQQTWTRFEAVMAPKVAGSWNLHLQTRDLPLDFFVMFSSLAGVIGTPAQSSYAAANAFLDALAHYRRALGLPALSIDWGPWSDVGMTATARRWTARGLSPISPERGLDLLEQMLQQPSSQIAVIPAAWPQFLAQFPDERSTRIFAALHSHSTRQRSDFRRQLEAAPAGRRGEMLAAHVRRQVMAVLDPEGSGELIPSHGFFELGMDSLMATEIRNRLQSTLAMPLPATLLLENGNLELLTTYLNDALALTPANGSEPVAEAASFDEEVEPLLSEIENLSESEIDRALATWAGQQNGEPSQ